MTHSQAIIVWISVLYNHLTEGFRFPENQLAIKTNDVIEGVSWGDHTEDDVFTASTAIADNISDTKTDFMSGMKDKRHDIRGLCGCHSKSFRKPLGEQTYPTHYFGRICDASKQNPNCGGSCTETYHDMLVLRHHVDHKKEFLRGPLHDSIKKDFYWDIEVSEVNGLKSVMMKVRLDIFSSLVVRRKSQSTAAVGNSVPES